MAPKSSVFLIGPGFIGQNVLDRLLDEDKYEITVLSRRKEQAEALEKLGARTVIGGLDNSEIISSQTEKSDIVFHTATADDLPSAKAVIEGVRQRVSKGLSTIYIHTSGTSVTDDNAYGEFKSDKIYTDSAPDGIDSLPDDAPHRPIDLEVISGAKEFGDKAKIAILLPPTIYGFNPKHKRLTIQIPTVARFALKHGYAGHVGKGLSVESMIHVNDLARGYMTLLHWMETTSAAEVRKNPYWFCENGKEFSWKEVGEEVGKSLYEKGKIQSPEPREFEKDKYDDLFGSLTGAILGLNSRTRAERLRALGWEAKEKGLWESWKEDELPCLLEEKN